MACLYYTKWYIELKISESDLENVMKDTLVQALDFNSIFLNPTATHNDGTYSQTPDLTLCRTINGRNTALFMIENKPPLFTCAGKPLDLTGGYTSSKAKRAVAQV